MIRWSPRLLAACSLTAAAAALSCGEVPTLENGIAYYTPVLLPLPAVALGDSLRDSLGVATPLTVRAFTRDSQEITGLTVTFVTTVLPTLVDIDSANGMLVAHDTTVGSVQIVGRIGERLQTSVSTLLVVPEPTGIARADEPAADTALSVPALRALPVTVTGVFNNATTTVNGIIVRYRIDSLAPSTVPPGSAVLTNASGTSLRPDSTIAVDTTKTSGSATRNVLVRAGSGVQRVYVSATANRLRDAKPLSGSPVQFVVDLKP
jgi:hypothetical protein